MTNSAQHLKPPRNEQMAYLRGLAARTGGTFAWPSTAWEASKEIDRLKKIRRTPRADRRRETRQVKDDMANRRGDSASVSVERETGGYGSSAHWR